MRYSILGFHLGAVAFGCLLGLPLLALIAEDSVRTDTVLGTMVKYSDNKLIIRTKEVNEYAYSLDSKPLVSIDGKATKVEDLRPGMRIRLTKRKSDQLIIRVEALDQKKDFMRDVEKK